jgi:hypothetical protein
MDAMFDNLQRSEPSGMDLLVSPAALSGTRAWMSDDSLLSIAHAKDPDALRLLDDFIGLSSKDALVSVRKYLIDLIQKENVVESKIPKILGKVTANQLSKLLSGLCDRDDIQSRHLHTLQLIAAVLQALQQR